MVTGQIEPCIKLNLTSILRLSMPCRQHITFKRDVELNKFERVSEGYPAAKIIA